MYTDAKISYADKAKFYSELHSEIVGLRDTNRLANFANISACLYHHLPDVNWVGFYLWDQSEETLIVGPFQGLPACVRIPLGKGVCGKSAALREIIRVDDVHQFEGHIACDARSRSEIVLPLVCKHRLVGVLDLDSPTLARFDDQDQRGLQQIVETLVSWIVL